MDKEPEDSQEDIKTKEEAEIPPETNDAGADAGIAPEGESEEAPPSDAEPLVEVPKTEKKPEKTYSPEEIEEIQQKGGLKGLISRWKLYAQISKLGMVARRFFVKNMTDGILTTLGVVIGFFFTFLRDPAKLQTNSIIVLPGIGAAVAMCVSGVLASYLTESAERRKALLEIRREMMILEPPGGEHKKKKSKTLQERAESFATVTASLIDGFSPFIAALIVMIPFYFTPKPEIIEFIISMGLCLVLLFFLGTYLGRLSKVNLIIYGLKMTVLGVLTFLFTWGLSFIQPA
ncbi:MAG: VIT1/CCC1 transporter family protein [Candidatus Hodarchaeota archaeon]